MTATQHLTQPANYRRGRKSHFGDDWVNKLVRRNGIDPETGQRTGPQLDRDTIPDPEGRALFIRISANDVKSYVCTARCKRPADAKHPKPWYEQVWHTIGQVEMLTLTAEETKLLPVVGEIGIARRRAENIVARIKEGLPPIEPKPLLPARPKAAAATQTSGTETFEEIAKRDPMSFDGVANRYLKEEARHFTRFEEYERVFKTCCHPVFGARPFVEIRRSDVSKFIDTFCIRMEDDEREQRLTELEALRGDRKSAYWKRDDAAKAMHIEYRRLRGNGGARMADSIASKVHALQAWFASLEENEDLEYEAPALCLKRNKKPKARGALTHAEIKSLWEATDNIDTYGAILRLLLLTGQRLTKVREMSWADIDFEAGTWNVPRGGERKPRFRLCFIGAKVNRRPRKFVQRRSVPTSVRPVFGSLVLRITN